MYRKAKRVVVIVDFEMDITKGLDRIETIWNFRFFLEYIFLLQNKTYCYKM